MSRKHALPRPVDCRHPAEDAGTAARKDDRDLISRAAWRLGTRQEGRGEAAGPKEAISIRIDRDVLEWFRNNSDHYQTRINSLLRAFVDEAKNRKSVR
ncbi:MAG TPA: BrnA antitoxin family protein [Arenibaculum sp.]|nr:BrnA antitoxin family protein [Arenibaculum sp.]